MPASEADVDHAGRDLLDRNRDLPGLGVLLDDDALATHLDREGAGPPVRVSRHRLRLKPGASAVLGARVQWREDTEPRDVLVAAYARAAGDKAEKDIGLARPDDVVAVDADRGLVTLRHTADRDLPGLDRLREPLLLARLLGAVPTGVRTLSYNPHRRWVGLVEHEQGAAVLRCYPGRAAASAWRALGELGERGAPVPGRVSRRTGWGTIVLDHVPGRSLEPSAALEDLWAAGACLATLHDTPAQLATAHRPPGAALDKAARAVATLLPEEAGRAHRLAHAVDERLRGGAAARAVPVHGDCSFDQIVRGGRRTRLIDLDRAHQGEAADDLGGLVAQLRRDRPEDVAAPARLVEGYRSRRPPPDPGRVATWGAHHCLTHAVDSFRRCEHGWAGGIGRWLDTAEALLEEAAW